MDYTPHFLFPLRELESERVKLVLFTPKLHAKEFVEKSKRSPEIFTGFPYLPFNSVEDFLERFFKARIVNDPASILFAVLDKTGDVSPRLAGVIGLVHTDAVNQSTEIGFVKIFPEFQRTHVTSNAVGLLLHYCLELPSNLAGISDDEEDPTSKLESEMRRNYGPGLGLRRVQWQAHADNLRSVRAAERMGFMREGILRWHRVAPAVKGGFQVSKGRKAICKDTGWHVIVLSLCWDDWEIEGKRKVVRRQMERL